MTETVAALDPTSRTLLARFLTGSGIELGPGSHPMPLPFPGVSIQYVDRWEPEENHKLFTNIDAGASFRKPDVIANLDVDALSAFADETQDFVIASHLLEHLVDPLRQLGEMHRVLKPGGVLLVFLPDRRFTFDRKRSPTPLAHLIEDHREQATVASDEHVEDYLRKTDVWDPSWNAQDLHEQFELNRRRSIHVHCWSEDEFLPVLEHSILEMRMRWELLDAAFIADASDGFEFGFVLRRAAGDATPTRLSSISASPGRRLRRKHGSARTPIGRWRVCAQCQAFRSRSAPGGCSAASATPSPSADDRERLQRAPVCAHPHKSGPGR